MSPRRRSLANLQDATGRPVAGAEAANDRALKHGGQSARLTEATAQEITVTLTASLTEAVAADSLDPITVELVRLYAAARAPVENFNRWAAENGYLTPGGKPHPFLKVYFTAINSARLALRDLRDHLRDSGEQRAASVVVQMQARERRP